jgi:stage II sporulation protein D
MQSFTALGAGGAAKSFDPANQTFTFKGKGWGHGLGLSQNGARYMAEQGYTYDQILKYYYQGIDLEKRF